MAAGQSKFRLLVCPKLGISGQPSLNQSFTAMVSISSVAVKEVIIIQFLSFEIYHEMLRG
jgi:hypothetical protein